MKLSRQIFLFSLILILMSFKLFPIAFDYTDDGNIKVLNNLGGDLDWETLTPEEFESKYSEMFPSDIAQKDLLFGEEGNFVKISEAQEVYFFDGDNWQKTALTPAPSGSSYSGAAKDANGNIYVSLGERFSGFNVIHSNGAKVIVAKKIQASAASWEWAQIVSGSGIEGFVGLAGNGSLYYVANASQNFKEELIATDVKVGKLFTFNGEPYAVAQDGMIFKISLDGIFTLEPTALKVEHSVRTTPLEAQYVVAQAKKNKLGISSGEAVLHDSKSNGNVKLSEKAQLYSSGNPNDSEFSSPRGDGAYDIFTRGTDEFFSDIIIEEIKKDGKPQKIYGRQDESQAVIDALVRIKAKNPILTGEGGVGKTTIAEKVAQRIIGGEIPSANAFITDLKDAYVVSTSPATISMLAMSNTPTSQAAAVGSYIRSLKTVEKKLGVKIILYVDEVHNFSEAQWNALKPFLDSKRNGILFIGSTTSREFSLAFKHDDALRRRFKQILVEEFPEADTLKLLKEAWLPEIEKKYNVKIDDEAIWAAIKAAPDAYPDKRRPQGPFDLLQDLAIRKHRENSGKSANLTPTDIYDFSAALTGIPINPYNPQNLVKYLDKLKGDLNSKVVGQAKMVNALVESWGNILMGTGKKHRVIMIMGPSGVGKTYGAEVMAELAFGSKNRLLVINGNEYQTGDIGLNTLFGAPNGVVSSDKTSGVFCEFLDGRGKGSNIIVINEIEKAHSDLVSRLMEVFDKGEVTGGDGRVRKLGRSIIILTSNRGARALFNPKSVKNMRDEELLRKVESITDKELKNMFLSSEGYEHDDKGKMPREIANRIDEWILANPITRRELATILQLEAGKKKTEYESQYRVTIEIDDKLYEEFASSEYDPNNGARIASKALQNKIDQAIKKAFGELGLTIGGKAKITLEKDDAEDTLKLIISCGRKKAEVTFDRNNLSLLDDSYMLKKLASLEQDLNQTVLGQEESNAAIVKAIRARAFRGSTYRPFTMMLVGSTGTGKTETGKALAQYLYGSPDRLYSFDMGRIRSEHEMNDVFGSPRGHVGSENSPFEQAVRSNPQGGVLIFDEIRNMGGGDPTVRQKLLKQFYKMMDEGTWVSPTGNEYDLSKWIMIFTGNDGEELFFGAPSDDLRLTTWKEMRVRDKLVSYLRGQSYDEAFLGRINYLGLQKPSLEKERLLIARKLVSRAIEPIEAQYGIKIDVTDEFCKEYARVYFSHSEGARSVERNAENNLAGDIGSVILDSLSKSINNIPELKKALKTGKIKLSLSENPSSDVLFYQGKKAPERKVLLNLVFEDNSGIKVNELSVDITSGVPQRRFASIEYGLDTAIHEAGHAVTFNPDILKGDVEFITIKSAGEYGGYCRYSEERERGILSRRINEEYVIEHAAKALAGNEATVLLLGSGYDAGRSSDLKSTRKLITKLLVEGGINPKLDGIPLDEHGNPTVRGQKAVLLNKEIDRIVEAARNRAHEIITQKRALIQKIAIELVKHGSMSGEKFRILRDSFKSALENHDTDLLAEFDLDESCNLKRELKADNLESFLELTESVFRVPLTDTGWSLPKDSGKKLAMLTTEREIYDEIQKAESQRELLIKSGKPENGAEITKAESYLKQLRLKLMRLDKIGRVVK